MNISIGCGRKKEEGFVGLDSHDFGWNKVWDANKDSIPFPDSSAEFIRCHNTLEHIERKYWPHLFNECWRVLKPNGILEIITPDCEASIGLAMQDPTHVAFVTKGTFTQYLTGARPRNADYGFKHWIVIQCRNYDEVEPRDIFCQMRPNK